jgi:transcriptional regulator with XRE-family HTH domain
MPDDDRSTRIRQFLKAELKRRNITYEELARRLNELGDHETKASVANKLSRGQFSAIFFVDSLRAIGIEKVDLEDI